MSEAEVWFESAAIRLGVEVKRLESQAAAAVLDSIRARYIRGNPRVWWLGLAVPYVEYDSSRRSLSSILPSIEGTVFFIPEIDDVDLPVYQVRATILEQLIADCPYLEYYVVGAMQEWLIIESDHNVFYCCQGDQI